MYFSDNPSDRYYERMMVGIPTADAHGRQAAKRKLYGDASTALNTPRNTVITHPP